MRRGRTLALAAAGLMLLPGQASAAPTVAISGVTVSGGTGSVTGTAAFQAITAAQSVVSEESVFSNGSVPAAVADAIGMHLTDATITPLANGGGLRFTWHLLSMPDQVPPEGLRYVWAFQIGTNVYQLQAKSSNVASVSTLEDPVGTAQRATQVNNWFQLRGACVGAYLGAPVNGCYHLAYLTGSFDVANKQVTINLPYETKDQIGRLVAPDFKPGAVVVDNAGTNTAGMVIAASGQAGVSNTTSSRYINGILPYYTAPQVSLGVASASAEPLTVTYGSPTTLSGGTFTGTVSGLTATKNTVFARACNGVECTYTSFKAL